MLNKLLLFVFVLLLFPNKLDEFVFFKLPKTPVKFVLFPNKVLLLVLLFLNKVKLLLLLFPNKLLLFEKIPSLFLLLSFLNILPVLLELFWFNIGVVLGNNVCWLFKEETPNDIFPLLLLNPNKTLLLFVLVIVGVLWPFLNKFISLYLISSKEKLQNCGLAVIAIYLKACLSLELISLIEHSLYWLYIEVGIISKVGSTNWFWLLEKIEFWLFDFAVLFKLKFVVNNELLLFEGCIPNKWTGFELFENILFLSLLFENENNWFWLELLFVNIGWLNVWFWLLFEENNPFWNIILFYFNQII